MARACSSITEQIASVVRMSFVALVYILFLLLLADEEFLGGGFALGEGITVYMVRLGATTIWIT